METCPVQICLWLGPCLPVPLLFFFFFSEKSGGSLRVYFIEAHL